MILTRGALSVLRRTGKAAGAILVVGALAAGLWFGIGVFRENGDGAAKAGGSPLLIYSEFGRSTDTIWAASPDDPTRRTKLTTVDHAPEYGIVAGLSPDGSRIAYTVLPSSGAAAIDAPAEVWVMDRNGRHRTRLAADADLPVAPVWSPDGSAVVFRRSAGSDSNGSFQIVKVTTAGVETTLLDTTDGVLPVGFAPDGSLYFARLSTGGTDLGVVRPDGSVTSTVAHLSDDFARDWHLSPDGSRLAYLAPGQAGDKISYHSVVIDLNPGTAVSRSLAASAFAPTNQSDEFNPIWRPDGGGVTVGRLAPYAGSGSPVLQMALAGGPTTSALAAPPRGFDVPLSWSPDVAYLAVRFFEGDSVTNPGRSWVTVVGSDGARRTVSSNSDVEVLGWSDSGG
jgi:Tol biopolymer transport system component